MAWRAAGRRPSRGGTGRRRQGWPPSGLGVGGLHHGVELGGIATLLARAVARPLPASERDVVVDARGRQVDHRSEEHTSELQSLMRISYAVFCLKKKTTNPSQANQLQYTQS